MVQRISSMSSYALYGSKSIIKHPRYPKPYPTILHRIRRYCIVAEIIHEETKVVPFQE